MLNVRKAAIGAMIALGMLVGQTASELLQKGIYTQETVGDLDAAMKIYRQVLAVGESGSHAAQAQYRLGVCLLKKGNQADAQKAFDKLAADYPDQQELIAAARQQLNTTPKLLPVPWSEGEMLELRLKLPGGAPIGALIHAIEKSQGGSLIVQTRTHVPNANQFSRSEAELETMKPKGSYYRHQMIGEYKTSYSARQARVEGAGKEPKSIDLDTPVYDNEVALALFRRLPLAAGYKGNLPIFAPASNMAVRVTAEVTAVEDVQTAAGKFKTFKLEIKPIQQTFWISDDSHRYIVKFEGGGVTGELNNVGRLDGPPNTFSEPAQGVSFSAPSGWLFLKNEAGSSGSVINLLDPQVKCHCFAAMNKIDKDLRAEADEKIATRVKSLKNYAVRQNSWQPRQVSGLEALSFTADYEEQGRKRTEYVTLVKSEKSGVVMVARVDSTDFDTFRPQLDRLIETVKLQ